MNIFIVAMPLKIVVGLLVLALTVRYMLPAMTAVFESVPRYWQRCSARPTMAEQEQNRSEPATPFKLQQARRARLGRQEPGAELAVRAVRAAG